MFIYIAWRMPKCYSSKPNDGKPACTKFSFSYDDEVEKNNKTMLLVVIKDLEFVLVLMLI